jgi:hypothetical protein
MCDASNCLKCIRSKDRSILSIKESKSSKKQNKSRIVELIAFAIQKLL